MPTCARAGPRDEATKTEGASALHVRGFPDRASKPPTLPYRDLLAAELLREAAHFLGQVQELTRPRSPQWSWTRAAAPPPNSMGTGCTCGARRASRRDAAAASTFRDTGRSAERAVSGASAHTAPHTAAVAGPHKNPASPEPRPCADGAAAVGAAAPTGRPAQLLGPCRCDHHPAVGCCPRRGHPRSGLVAAAWVAVAPASTLGSGANLVRG